MARITEIYKQYQVSSSLQAHQLRVAAVAKQICDNLTVPVDTDTVITACLLHDVANVLKFDFSATARLFEPEGVEYWQKIQKQVAEKYKTTNEHEATMLIAKELNVSPEVLDCIESIDFGKAIETLARSEIEPRLCDYADLRVSPDGVVSLDERLEDGNKRYKHRPDKWLADDVREKVEQACHDNEQQLFKNCRLKPTDITDDSTAPIVEQLKAYEI